MQKGEAVVEEGFLPDAEFLAQVEAGASWRLRVWEPEATVVVLGRGNAASREVRGAACSADGVCVLRRMGGGGAVVLARGCLVVSLAKRVSRDLEAGGYLDQVVDLIGDALHRAAGISAVRRGTGDLCIADRKVLGSSLFRRRQLLLYQGSLLVSMDLGQMDRYLLHPSREPEYRKGRSHAQFLTTLAESGVRASCSELSRRLQAEIEGRIGEIV